MLLSRRTALGLAGALALPRIAIGQADNRPSIVVAVQKISTSNTLEPMREQSNVGQRVFYTFAETLTDHASPRVSGASTAARSNSSFAKTCASTTATR